jgi:hypothetical protein
VYNLLHLALIEQEGLLDKVLTERMVPRILILPSLFATEGNKGDCGVGYSAGDVDGEVLRCGEVVGGRGCGGCGCGDGVSRGAWSGSGAGRVTRIFLVRKRVIDTWAVRDSCLGKLPSLFGSRIVAQ